MKNIKININGENYFLSNFYSIKIVYEGLELDSSEAAFQAMKCINNNWRKVLINDNDFDYTYFWAIIAQKLKNMEEKKYYDNYKISQARIIAERLRDDSYFDMHYEGYEIPKKNRIEQEVSSKRRDIEYFCYILQKYSLKWWI